MGHARPLGPQRIRAPARLDPTSGPGAHRPSRSPRCNNRLGSSPETGRSASTRSPGRSPWSACRRLTCGRSARQPPFAQLSPKREDLTNSGKRRSARRDRLESHHVPRAPPLAVGQPLRRHVLADDRDLGQARRQFEVARLLRSGHGDVGFRRWPLVNVGPILVACLDDPYRYVCQACWQLVWGVLRTGHAYASSLNQNQPIRLFHI